MVIEYKINLHNGELTVTQRVECGPGAAATQTQAAAGKGTAAAANQQKSAAGTAASKASVFAKREGYKLGAAPQTAVKPPLQSSTSQPLVVVMGPVIVTADALEGGSGEPSTTGTDN